MSTIFMLKIKCIAIDIPTNTMSYDGGWERGEEEGVVVGGVEGDQVI